MKLFRKFIESIFGKQEARNETSNNENDVNDSIDQTSPQDNIDSHKEQQLIDSVTIINKKFILTSKTTKILKNEFFAFDIETTGLNSYSDRIVELAIIKYVNGYVADQFHTLINPGFSMPASASRINNITDELLLHAPTEDTAIKMAYPFLEPILSGESIICAHNASFDLSLLKAALRRNGISANIKYIDTLSESRKLIKDTPNHKLGTLTKHLNIVNNDPHRATGDAKACGDLLLKLIDKFSKGKTNKRKSSEGSVPTQQELEVCAFIQHTVEQDVLPIDLLRFYKNSSNYVTVSYLYTMFEFKFAKKGHYFIVPIQYSKDINLPKMKATMSEGGSHYERVFFNSYEDLALFKNFFISIYETTIDQYEEFKNSFDNRDIFDKQIDEYYSLGYQLTDTETIKLLSQGQGKKSIQEINLNLPDEININIEELELKPIHNLVSLNQIKNKNSPDKGFKEGFPLWEKGDKIRKQGQIKEAIALFDEARFLGYDAPALYESYALAYRKLKDYENEIAILNEGLNRLEETNPEHNGTQYSKLSSRREKAAALLLKSNK
ncbi:MULTISPECIES: exonuclease domain-containing protein [Aerococcus]|uniref:exonuclease domain-containing protein n=1 Tax=Aerococcus TaxID=1375 RepID=UPI0015ECBA81|nr:MULTISPECIES: exonuclease domain-containing protein [Aerococcus]MDK8133001.1 exonuclease domain-containing protein [Aerococcus urinae]MDK8484561.1 exonuclease domain-containing protein [Aerococcus urinae]MDL5179408.1 exonuclease domain-containing protein [Aerococcus tenax]MDL5208308.1 exonuclease domain-containing protein [Aerococcus tenax]WIW72944.1 exonuclease domain-containing protein [Aerococcus tenax]